MSDCPAKIQGTETNRDRKVPSIFAKRVFLLSPANISGIRGERLLCDSAKSDLSLRLRGRGVPLGEVFTSISGLYFRGKLAYARKFAQAPLGVAGAFVITTCGGLMPPETLVTLERLRKISATNLDLMNPLYLGPLDRDSQALSDRVGSDCQIVLLGSIATPKYADPLLRIFGDRLVFPAEFVGRGDMSRGGLMLRCVQSGSQLTYVPLEKAVRHGPKPPKLTPLTQLDRAPARG
jgi:hypothetical protein